VIGCDPRYCDPPGFLVVPTLQAHIRGEQGDALVTIDPARDSVGVLLGMPTVCDALGCSPPDGPPYFTAGGWETEVTGRVVFDGHPIPMPA